MPSRSIAHRLESARLALHNALAESELLAALSQFGYDESRLQQGKSLYESALALWQNQQQKQSRRRAASLAYSRVNAALTRAYMRSVKLCRILYRADPLTYRALGLAGPRSTAFATRVAQMRLFYTTALGSPEILSTLAEYGFSESQLQADFALVALLESARSQREMESGEAQGATRSRKEALSVLGRWMGDFAVIARLALEESPQRMEMLGLAGD